MFNGDVDSSRQPRQSAGTASAMQVVGRGFQGPSKEMVDADIKEIDEGGTVWLSCSFRGTYGKYPRRFVQKILYLTPAGMVVRPVWYSFSRKTFHVSEEIFDVRKRPYNLATDWNVKAKGRYSQGGQFSHAGFEFIVCHTRQGVIEFAVPRPDVPLVLHYINRK